MELKPCGECGRFMPVNRTAYGKVVDGKVIVEIRRTFMEHYSDSRTLKVCPNSGKPAQERSVEVGA